ncbi:MAG: restriction endonuclease subunit S [Stenotrophomonas acidaminiphila]|uniref:restriction endonuclease subunit S n=1 Tax=Stenotrophomonas acidaminiphila TaxID=128780 RepID=UPI000AEB4FA7|nr:restriction endonuclease subunit S [Stenotrophomonas acidaminiphila]MBN8800434.1 restriction endonuclease subunit S [Stenotrophomonas acidaminiphila]MDF9442014.1 restriction endonuclease subunit S [Stenotrophomonas acidaminiphila]
MSDFHRIPIADLVVGERPKRANPDVTEVWNLNLDQIESDSGRILARVMVSPKALGPSTYPFEAGTVLYSKLRPYLNKVVVADRDGYATTELVPLKCDAERVLPSYLAYFLRSSEFLSFANAVVAGAKMPRMVMSEFWKFKVPLPPLPEQHRIAAILDKTDTLRTRRREVLAQLDRLTQSIFVDLFGDPAKNPRSWPTRTLKELGKVSTGGTPPSALDGMFGGDIPFVTPGDLESNQVVKRKVTEAGAQKAGTVRAGASLVCCIGATIGKMGLATVRSSFNQQLNAVEWFSDAMDDQYGLAALRFFKPTIIAWGASTTLPILKKSSFEKVSIPVPPLELQQEFARRSRSVTKLGERLRVAQEVESTLFDALQDRAFQGAL